MNIVYSKNLSCIPCNRRGCNNDNLKSDCLSELDFNSIKTNIGIIIDEQDN